MGYGNEMGKKCFSYLGKKKTKEQNNLLYLYALILVYYIYIYILKWTLFDLKNEGIRIYLFYIH